MTGTHSRGRSRPTAQIAGDHTSWPAGGPAAAGPGIGRALPVMFHGRTARDVASPDSQAECARQLATCREVIADYGGQVTVEYFDESCRPTRHHGVPR